MQDSWLWSIPANHFKVAITVIFGANWKQGRGWYGGEMLTVKKITQKGSTLYVAQYPVPQQETKIFTINVETGGKAHGFSFNQELFPAQ